MIDINPEKTKARELALKYKGRVWLGDSRDDPAQTEIALWQKPKKRDEVGVVIIDKTQALNQYIDDHQHGRYVYPNDIREIGENLPRKNWNGFYEHHFQMVKTEVETAKGKTIHRWVKTRNPDHWHHTGMFEAVAALNKPSLNVPANILTSFDRAGGLIRSA